MANEGGSLWQERLRCGMILTPPRSKVLCGGLSRPSRRLTQFAFLDLHAWHEVGNDEGAFVSIGISL